MRSTLLIALVALLPGQALSQAALPAASGGVGLVPLTGPAVVVTAAQLAALPHTCVSLNAPRGAGHAPIHGRYCGVALRTLLSRVGVPQGEALRGPVLRQYVVAEAADGYRAVFALPELDPGFTVAQVIVADTRDGHALDAQEGPLRIVAPAELRPARWVRQLKRVSVREAT